MDQLKKNQVGFEEAKQHNFYPGTYVLNIPTTIHKQFGRIH